MSTGSQTEQAEKVKGKKKAITFEIQEDIMNKRFLMRILNSLTQAGDYEQQTLFSSPLGDSMAIEVKKNDQKLMVVTKGESDLSLQIKGDSQLLKEFIHDIALEASTLIAAELSVCLRQAYPQITIDKLRKNLRHHYKNAIKNAVEDCAGCPTID